LKLAGNAGGQLLQRVSQQLLFGQLALRGCATHGNFMFTAADCNAQQQKALNIFIAKYFCDADAQILSTKYDEKMVLLMTD
jgi:hypothetical protein